MSKRNNFCSAPWSSLTIDPDGQSKVCCVSSDKNRQLVNLDTVAENPYFQEIRQAFIKDQQHPNCTNCWREEQNANTWISMRSIFQDEYYANLDSNKDFKLEYLDARWSNQCNLSCVYCTPSWSSTWGKLVGQTQRVSNNFAITKQSVKHLKNVLLAGGEPTLIKQNIQLLEMLLQCNPDVAIQMNSNLTWNQDNKIIKLLNQFKNVTIIASFESIGTRFEYIRRGANWPKFVDNLAYCSTMYKKVQANMVYFSLSAYGIVDAINVARKYIADNEIYIRNEFSGADFHEISVTALTRIKNKLKQDATQLPAVIKDQIDRLLSITNTTSTNTNLSMIKRMDKLTKSNHKQIFAELYYE